jgi:hypothetical protein
MGKLVSTPAAPVSPGKGRTPDPLHLSVQTAARHWSRPVPLHMIKLSVGTEDVEDLRQWHARRLAETGRVFHRTRSMPRRREELLAGGSIYWVIKGFVLARQRFTGIERTHYSDGSTATLLVLDPDLVRTLPTPHRPFQGWRYLDPAAAPGDLRDLAGGAAEMPLEMLTELRQLGLM